MLVPAIYSLVCLSEKWEAKQTGRKPTLIHSQSKRFGPGILPGQ